MSECPTTTHKKEPVSQIAPAADPQLRRLSLVGASFFLSSNAVNPGLTTLANALRAGDPRSERPSVAPLGSSQLDGNARADTYTIQPPSTELQGGAR